MKLLADMDDPDYCETRAFEMLHTLRETRPRDEDYIEMSEKIISLLALARVQRGIL